MFTKYEISYEGGLEVAWNDVYLIFTVSQAECSGGIAQEVKTIDEKWPRPPPSPAVCPLLVLPRVQKLASWYTEWVRCSAAFPMPFFLMVGLPELRRN